MSFRTWLIHILGGTPNDPRDFQLGKSLPEKVVRTGPHHIYNVPGYMSAATAVCGMKEPKHWRDKPFWVNKPAEKLLEFVEEWLKMR